MYNICCYLLQSESNENRTYIGVTNDINRRIRQHNGEIVGGAKYTTMFRPWKIVCFICGFEDYNTALQLEWRLHHISGKVKTRKRKYTGLIGRYKSFEKILNLDKWTSNAPSKDTLKLHLIWIINDYPKLKIPKHYLQYYLSNNQYILIN